MKREIKKEFEKRKCWVEPAELQGDIKIPPSKSIAHRQLIAVFLGALGREKNGKAAYQAVNAWTLGDEAASIDIQTTKTCLLDIAHALETKQTEILILNCHESGSTLRFLIPIVAALGLCVVFTGEGRLPQRPLTAYQKCLLRKGIQWLPLGHHAKSFLPFQQNGQLKAGRFDLEGHNSSQYLTGLLCALPLLEESSQIVLTSELTSASYVQLTLDCLETIGFKYKYAAEKHGIYQIEGKQALSSPQKVLPVEADESQAAFFRLAQFLGQNIELEGLNPQSKQGDRKLAHYLTILKNSRFEGSSQGGLQVDLSGTPDIFPVLAIACALTPGEHRLYHLDNLRIKESDRLEAMCKFLQALGIRFKKQKSELLIKGILEIPNDLTTWFQGGQEVKTFRDHRIAMSQAIVATVCQKGLILDDYQCVEKSFPDFWERFKQLGGRMKIMNEDSQGI